MATLYVGLYGWDIGLLLSQPGGQEAYEIRIRLNQAGSFEAVEPSVIPVSSWPSRTALSRLADKAQTDVIARNIHNVMASIVANSTQGDGVNWMVKQTVLTMFNPGNASHFGLSKQRSGFAWSLENDGPQVLDWLVRDLQGVARAQIPYESLAVNQPPCDVEGLRAALNEAARPARKKTGGMPGLEDGSVKPATLPWNR